MAQKVIITFALWLGSRVRPSDVSLRDLGVPYVRPSANSSGLGRVWRPSASRMRPSECQACPSALKCVPRAADLEIAFRDVSGAYQMFEYLSWWPLAPSVSVAR